MVNLICHQGIKKRIRMLEEDKELKIANYDLETANTRMQLEIHYLKVRIIEYKDRFNESMKYK